MEYLYIKSTKSVHVCAVPKISGIFFVLHSKLENSKAIEGGGNGSHVFLEFCKYTGDMQSYIDYRPCLDNQNQDAALNICVQFSVSSSNSKSRVCLLDRN